MQHADRRPRFAATRLATGLQLHYAEQGDPGGETILFLPAYADSWFSYSRVLPLLPARYHAYALDQRGHGDSERPDCCYTVDDLVADTVAFLDAAGIERATLVGHSGSCFTARRVAVTDPDRIAGLVLIGAPLSLAKPAVLAFQAAVHVLEDPVAAEFVREPQAGAVHVPLPNEFMEGTSPGSPQPLRRSTTQPGPARGCLDPGSAMTRRPAPMPSGGGLRARPTATSDAAWSATSPASSTDSSRPTRRFDPT
jgi:pimeloyl-ACP methyl ester carboxylesterase